MGICRSFSVATTGRGFQDIRAQVQKIVSQSGTTEGLCTVFCHHTSASIILCENADPAVRKDLASWLARLVEDGDNLFTHTAEGADDMAAHIRSVLTCSSLGIPIIDGALDLGTWQGLYLWEHRYRGHRRRLSVVVIDA